MLMLMLMGILVPIQSLVVLLIRDLWMWGMTPPPAMVPLMRVSSSSSPRMASCRCRGVILFTFRSLLALPASSSTSAVRYSRMDAKYTAAVAPTRPFAEILVLRCRWIRPTGNWSQANKPPEQVTRPRRLIAINVHIYGERKRVDYNY